MVVQVAGKDTHSPISAMILIIDHYTGKGEPVCAGAAGGERIGYEVTAGYYARRVLRKVGDMHCRLRLGGGGREQSRPRQQGQDAQGPADGTSQQGSRGHQQAKAGWQQQGQGRPDRCPDLWGRDGFFRSGPTLSRPGCNEGQRKPGPARKFQTTGRPEDPKTRRPEDPKTRLYSQCLS